MRLSRLAVAGLLALVANSGMAAIGTGTARLHAGRDSRAFPYAMQVALTPVAPFHKGERLPPPSNRSSLHRP
jgi:hypothetical protein